MSEPIGVVRILPRNNLFPHDICDECNLSSTCWKHHYTSVYANTVCACCDNDTLVKHYDDYPFRRWLCENCDLNGGRGSSIINDITHYVNGAFI